MANYEPLIRSWGFEPIEKLSDDSNTSYVYRCSSPKKESFVVKLPENYLDSDGKFCIRREKDILSRVSDFDFVPKLLGFIDNKSTYTNGLDFGSDVNFQGVLALFKEYVFGRPLEREEKVCGFGNQSNLISLVLRLHDLGFVGIDLNNSNFIMDDSGKVWIVDLGGVYRHGDYRPDNVIRHVDMKTFDRLKSQDFKRIEELCF